MAQEARAAFSLSIIKRSGNLTLINHQGHYTFSADVDGAKGPCVGAITVTPDGVDINLSQLSSPGLYIITNQDPENKVEWGIHDGTKFMPMNEALPGESYPARLSSNFGREFGTTGTGTINTTTCTLRIRSYNENCNVLVEMFER